MSLLITQNKTNTKIQIFQSLQKISHMQQLTHAQKENLSTNVHGNQQNIYDRNIQHQ